MRVLLVYSNDMRDVLPPPPIGLSYVASATADAGHEVRFLDLLVGDSDGSALERTIRDFKPEVIGVSVRNIDNVVHQRLQVHLTRLHGQLARMRELTNAPIVLGGPAISILSGDALTHMDADYVIRGEGEEAFPLLLEALQGERGLNEVPGLLYRDGERLAGSPPRPLCGFDGSGMERWIDWKRYARAGSTWPIQTKRGCPMICNYCTYPAVEGKGMRKRPPEEVVDEIERVARTVNPRCFEFIDSTFNLPQSHAIAICEAIIRRGLKVRLTTMGINPLGVSAELLTLMKRAGFHSMMVTPESASDATLKGLSKGFGRRDVERCARLVRESGIASMWFFMLGGPGETKETVEETVGFAERELDFPGCVSMFTTGIRVLPGTQLAELARKEGRIGPDQSLAESVFYFSDEVSEKWMLKRINQAIARCPRIVHAAEDPASDPNAATVYRLLHTFRVAPPYWRLLPGFLTLKPVHKRRMRILRAG